MKNKDELYRGKVISLTVHKEELNKLDLPVKGGNPYGLRDHSVLKVNLAKLSNDIDSFVKSGSYRCTLKQFSQLLQDGLCYG